jgi:hypothetical protein
MLQEAAGIQRMPASNQAFSNHFRPFLQSPRLLCSITSSRCSVDPISQRIQTVACDACHGGILHAQRASSRPPPPMRLIPSARSRRVETPNRHECPPLLPPSIISSLSSFLSAHPKPVLRTSDRGLPLLNAQRVLLLPSFSETTHLSFLERISPLQACRPAGGTARSRGRMRRDSGP